MCIPETCNVTQLNHYVDENLPKPLQADIECGPISFDEWKAKDVFALLVFLL